MDYKRLFLLVEGDDDERFIKQIITPLFEENYKYIKPWKYSQKKKNKIRSFIKSIKSMKASFIFFHDFNKANCYTQRLEKLTETYSLIARSDIIVVRMEIEGWYLAGLSDSDGLGLGLNEIGSTDNTTKEDFNSVIPRDFDSRIDFMNEVLMYFSIDVAKDRNASFSYFLSKYLKL